MKILLMRILDWERIHFSEKISNVCGYYIRHPFEGLDGFAKRLS
jgi:hypothetical protein